MKSFEKYLPLCQKVVEDYERDHPHWRIEVLFSLIRWSLRSLKHYIEDVHDPEITWASPLVELHFPIEWNWKVKLTDNLARGGHIFGKFTNKNTATKELAIKTLSETMARQFNAMTLAELTNWAWFEKRNSYFLPIFPHEFDCRRLARSPVECDPIRPAILYGPAFGRVTPHSKRPARRVV